MANRFFTNQAFYLEKAPVFLWAKVSVGSTGAPTLSRGKGISSVSRTGVGAYTITLQDKYPVFLNCEQTQLLASGTPAADFFKIVSETVATDGKINIQYLNEAGAVEVGSGTVLHFTISLSNSSAV